MTYHAALLRVASYPDRLMTPFDFKDVAEKMQDMACRALGYRADQPELPDLRHAPKAADR